MVVKQFSTTPSASSPHSMGIPARDLLSSHLDVPRTNTYHFPTQSAKPDSIVVISYTQSTIHFTIPGRFI